MQAITGAGSVQQAIILLQLGKLSLLHPARLIKRKTITFEFGNKQLMFQQGIRRFHDAIAWLSQIIMFVTLGHLCFPSRLLEVSGNAKTAGQIVVQVSPEKGEPIRATAQIPAGTAENDVARNVSTALQMAASGHYSVEVDDGEDVLVKKKDGERDFAVTVVENTVQGVTVNVDTE